MYMNIKCVAPTFERHIKESAWRRRTRGMHHDIQSSERRMCLGDRTGAILGFAYIRLNECGSYSLRSPFTLQGIQAHLVQSSTHHCYMPPREMKSRAAAAPMPLVPPVTKHTFPLKSIFSLLRVRTIAGNADRQQLLRQQRGTSVNYDISVIKRNRRDPKSL
jgi:hypothetical protein